MFRLSDYIFDSRDLLTLLKWMVRMGQRVFGSSNRKIAIGLGILIGIGALLLVATDISFGFVLLWLFAIAVFYWDLNSRISIGAAFVGLALIPILLTFGAMGSTLSEIWAERLAVWAYFLLVLGVLKQIWDFRKK